MQYTMLPSLVVLKIAIMSLWLIMLGLLKDSHYLESLDKIHDNCNWVIIQVDDYKDRIKTLHTSTITVA